MSRIASEGRQHVTQNGIMLSRLAGLTIGCATDANSASIHACGIGRAISHGLLPLR